MFGELLESRARRPRNRAGVIASIAGHVAMMALAVIATRTQLTARVPDERIVPLPVLHPAPQPSAPSPAKTTARPAPTPSAPPLGPVIVPPISVPEGITPVDPVDIPIPMPGEWEWTPRSSAAGGDRASASPGGAEDGIPFASGVDKPAMALAGNPAPRYPEILRRNGVRGEVTVEVVVDTTGRARVSTLRIVSADHPLMADAVRDAIVRARFLPAEVSGRKVQMWVRQSFVFEVR